MPSDDTYHLVGELRSGDYFLELHTAQGAVWEFDRSKDALKLLGQRVEVIGERIGFNDLRVHQIWRAGDPRPPRPRLSPIMRQAVIAIAMLVVIILLLRLI